MDLRDVPDDELRQMLADTERLIGSASDAARRLRRELERRELALLDRAWKIPPQPQGAAP